MGLGESRLPLMFLIESVLKYTENESIEAVIDDNAAFAYSSMFSKDAKIMMKVNII